MNVPPLHKILHVDDSEDIREPVRHGLEDGHDFTLLFCASAAEAQAKAPDFAPDLLLLDSIMPDTSGLELYRELKALPGLADTPAVFLTTEAATIDLSSFLRVGAVDIIAKPFDVASLADTLQEIWREYWTRKK